MVHGVNLDSLVMKRGEINWATVHSQCKKCLHICHAECDLIALSLRVPLILLWCYLLTYRTQGIRTLVLNCKLHMRLPFYISSRSERIRVQTSMLVMYES